MDAVYLNLTETWPWWFCFMNYRYINKNSTEAELTANWRVFWVKKKNACEDVCISLTLFNFHFKIKTNFTAFNRTWGKIVSFGASEKWILQVFISSFSFHNVSMHEEDRQPHLCQSKYSQYWLRALTVMCLHQHLRDSFWAWLGYFLEDKNKPK